MERSEAEKAGARALFGRRLAAERETRRHETVARESQERQRRGRAETGKRTRDCGRKKKKGRQSRGRESEEREGRVIREDCADQRRSKRCVEPRALSHSQNAGSFFFSPRSSSFYSICFSSPSSSCSPLLSPTEIPSFFRGEKTRWRTAIFAERLTRFSRRAKGIGETSDLRRRRGKRRERTGKASRGAFSLP